jgi:hypothetical protein
MSMACLRQAEESKDDDGTERPQDSSISPKATFQIRGAAAAVASGGKPG